MPVYTPFANEATVLAQLKHQHDTYRTGATGTPVQTDQNNRETTLKSAHTAKTNAQLGTGLNHTVVSNGIVTAYVYSGGNYVQAAGTPTFMEAQVAATLALAGAYNKVFDKGGGYTSNYVPLSPYVDPLWLIEAAKLTGEKAF